MVNRRRALTAAQLYPLIDELFKALQLAEGTTPPLRSLAELVRERYGVSPSLTTLATELESWNRLGGTQRPVSVPDDVLTQLYPVLESIYLALKEKAQQACNSREAALQEALDTALGNVRVLESRCESISEDLQAKQRLVETLRVEHEQALDNLVAQINSAQTTTQQQAMQLAEVNGQLAVMQTKHDAALRELDQVRAEHSRWTYERQSADAQASAERGRLHEACLVLEQRIQQVSGELAETQLRERELREALVSDRASLAASRSELSRVTLELANASRQLIEAMEANQKLTADQAALGVRYEAERVAKMEASQQVQELFALLHMKVSQIPAPNVLPAVVSTMEDGKG